MAKDDVYMQIYGNGPDKCHFRGGKLCMCEKAKNHLPTYRERDEIAREIVEDGAVFQCEFCEQVISR